MLLLLSLRVACASSKNYINTFKVRSRLSEFFKHVHPDQMAQAPVIFPSISDKNKRLKSPVPKKFQLLLGLNQSIASH